MIRQLLLVALLSVVFVASLPGGRLAHAQNQEQQVAKEALEVEQPEEKTTTKKLAAVGPVFANCTMYAKILADNVQIKGDSKDRNHLNWLEIFNVAHEIQVNGDNRDHKPLTFQKNIDRSTMSLISALVEGTDLDFSLEYGYCQHISYTSEFTIQARYTDAYVSAYKTVNGVESWEITYATVKWTWLQNSAQGSITDNWQEDTNVYA